jgi:hypothetical protein
MKHAAPGGSYDPLLNWDGWLPGATRGTTYQ